MPLAEAAIQRETPELGRIFILDDEEDVALGLKAILEQQGYAVDICSTPLTAAFAVRQFRPDVILLDLSMPALSGETLLGIARMRRLWAGAQIILHSGRSTAELAEIAKRTAVDGYFSKGDDLTKLLESMPRWVRGRNPAATTGARPDQSLDVTVLLRSTPSVGNARARELQDGNYVVWRYDNDDAAIEFLRAGLPGGVVVVDTSLHEAIRFLNRSTPFDVPTVALSSTPLSLARRFPEVRALSRDVERDDLIAAIDRALADADTSGPLS